MSTIAAISTPLGAGGIGIVRISGKEALIIADAIFHFSEKGNKVAAGGYENLSGGDTAQPIKEAAITVNANETINAAAIESAECGENNYISENTKDNINTALNINQDCRGSALCSESIPLQNWKPLKMNFGIFYGDDFCDKGYAVYFPANKAFTGENTVEFYLHGGVRIMQGALEKLLSKGAELADRGEFTKRAYLSGRLTLSDAEGVIDMINAESAAGLRAAYRLMDGALSKKIDAVCDRLLTLISTLEATLDYPDEMEDEVLPVLSDEIGWAEAEVEKLINSAKAGRMAKHGITAVLAGKTNSGKSSLMNAILKRERAIVTPIAGTTRDTVSETFECEGVKINLIDTAGIRDSEDFVEKEGIARAKKAYEGADVILHVIDTETDGIRYQDFGDRLVFTILNKCDKTSFACPRRANTFAISAKTGENVDIIVKAILNLYKGGKVEGGEIITNERHLSALNAAKTSLKNAVLQINSTLDCLLIDLRGAYSALGEITGRTATEDIVNAVFTKFCVGK